MKSKKKILVLVDWFAPGYKAGGPIQSCVNFSFALKDDFNIEVLTTDTDHGETEPYSGITPNQWITNIDPGIKTYYARKKTVSLGQLKKVILEADADYVYLNQLFSPHLVLYPLWLKYRGKLKSDVVLCPRGALYESALSVKRYKKTPFLKLFRWMGLHRKIIFHATNEREKMAINRYFPGSKIIIADNLPLTSQTPFVTCVKKPGTLKCVFVARIVPIKNLLFLLNVLEKVKTGIELSIIGPAEDAAYWMQCQEKMKSLPGNIRINYLGPKNNNELMPVLKEHHLFILPTTGENFGHSIFEALLAGRPVLISDQTPWLNLSEKKTGWDLPLDQPDEFVKVIEAMGQWDQSQFNGWAEAAWQYAHDFITNPQLKQRYLQLFI